MWMVFAGSWKGPLAHCKNRGGCIEHERSLHWEVTLSYCHGGSISGSLVKHLGRVVVAYLFLGAETDTHVMSSENFKQSWPLWPQAKVTTSSHSDYCQHAK
ncbi:hypothetical protein ILYODFUR_027324 [Ilyodon furcidens]|uniref:Uncharacterized protein n=1 Tax=Ilyodon furcidens TaxID=33524 RepID=A0ABV0SPN0_9TELE